MGSEHKGVRAAEPDEHLASPTLQCAELACNALPWQAQHVDHAPAGGQLSLTRTGAPRTARNHAPAARRDGRRGLGGTGLTAPRWQWCHETSVACSCNHLTLMCWSSASSSLAGTLTAAAAASLTSHASWSFSAAQLTTLAWHATCEGSVGKGAYQAGRQAAYGQTSRCRRGQGAAARPPCPAPHLASGPSLSIHSCRPRPVAKSTYGKWNSMAFASASCIWRAGWQRTAGRTWRLQLIAAAAAAP